jgi:hypothetical protein
MQQGPEKYVGRCEEIALKVDYVGQRPRIANCDDVGLCVFVWRSSQDRCAAVLMIDKDNGASITNAANEIIKFVQEWRLRPHGISWERIRWVYRDTMEKWDELEVSNTAAHGVGMTVRTLGARTVADAISTIESVGFVVDSHDLVRIEMACERAN